MGPARRPGATAARGPRASRLVMLATAALVALLVSGTAAGTARTLVDDRGIRIQSEGNELFARRQAPVTFASLEELSVEIERPLPALSSAMRLTRAAPQQTVDYLLGVTRDGVLVVGQQTRTYDFATERLVFARGELQRSYQPLESGRSWTWLVELSVSREASATLQISAPTSVWPVESVSIALVRAP